MLSAFFGKPVRALDFQMTASPTSLMPWPTRNVGVSLKLTLTANIRVYELPVGTVRIDTSTVFTFGDKDDPDSLFQHGHSKDHRPDLPQVKIPLATLDPLACLWSVRWWLAT